MSNSETVSEVLGHWDAGRIEESLGRLAPDVEYRTPMGTLRGREEVAAFWNGMVPAFSPRRHVIVRKLDVGETGIATGHFEGTHSGPLGMPDGSEIPASGNVVEGLEFAVVAEFEAGLVRSVDVYFDNLTFMSQLGLIPTPASA